jgi:DegV family protein with EDD domain
MIKIVTDSTCDLPASMIEEHDITVVPINIQFGSKTYAEGVTIDQSTFYKMIEETGIFPTTSQPSVGEFTQVYRRLAKDADSILSIHVTGKLSGTCQSAEMAKREVAEEVEVHVFDTLGGSSGMGFMCVEAARLIQAGKSVEEILSRLEVMRERINIFLTMNTLEYVRRSGRVGALKFAFGSILNMKPVVVLEEGLLEAKENLRSRKKALARLLELTEEAVGTSKPINLAVIHAEAPEVAEEMLERAKGIFNCQETFVDDLAISLAVQFGPGTVGLVSYPV